MWIPDNINIDSIKAILVLCHSYNSNGLGLVNSDEWQSFAIQNNLALLSVHLKDINQTSYTRAANGSGDALLLALDSITTKNNVSKIKELPFLFRGYSAGGVFSYFFSEFLPEKVICFVNIRGGSLDFTSDINNSIPGLMLVGEHETNRIERIKNIISPKRDTGALWSYAIEPDMDHFGNLQKSYELARHFFTIALDKRLSNDSEQLNLIEENTGWLGNNSTKEIFYFSQFPNQPKEASWLLNETFSNYWKNFQTE